MSDVQDKSDYIISAYAFDGTGGAVKLHGKDIAEKVKSKELAWVHLDASAAESRAWLDANVDYLDHVILDALLAEETRPRITEFKDGALVILRGVNLNDNAEPEDMISIRFWIDSHRIISTRIRKLKAVHDIRERLENGHGPKNAADFFVALSTRLFERMEPVISDLDERTDDVEEALLNHPDSALRHEVVDIRKKAIMLRRYIAPQKEVMSYMRASELKWLSQIHKRQIHENHDRILRYIEDLDAVRERAQIVKDELANALADKMNKNMYVLSIVASIFLPLGFLTGLLGINVGGMPGADSDVAFWIVSALCFGFIILVGGLFKFLKWI